jgi:hypothetical protein
MPTTPNGTIAAKVAQLMTAVTCPTPDALTEALFAMTETFQRLRDSTTEAADKLALQTLLDTLSNALRFVHELGGQLTAAKLILEPAQRAAFLIAILTQHAHNNREGNDLKPDTRLQAIQAAMPAASDYDKAHATPAKSSGPDPSKVAKYSRASDAPSASRRSSDEQERYRPNTDERGRARGDERERSASYNSRTVANRSALITERYADYCYGGFQTNDLCSQFNSGARCEFYETKQGCTKLHLCKSCAPLGNFHAAVHPLCACPKASSASSSSKTK